jgi:hypothetical protein
MMLKLLFSTVALLSVFSMIECKNSISEVTVKYKAKASLWCNTTENPDYTDGTFYTFANDTYTKLTITDNNRDKYKLDTNELQLLDPKREELEADYRCKFNGETDEMRFKINQAPFLYKPEKISQTITEGGFSIMICKVLFGGDKLNDESWNWFHEGNLVNETKGRIEVDVGTDKSFQETTLTVYQVTKSDKGLYKCQLTNAFGVANETVVLRVKDVFAALWPFLAIVAEVFLLCLIILIYEMKFAKKKNAEEEGEQSQNLMGRDHGSDVKKRNTRT